MAKKDEFEGAVSLSPSTFQEPTGLVQEADVTWHSPLFGMIDLKKGTNLQPYLYVELEPTEGESWTQYWSCGGADKFQAREDGKCLIGTAVLSPTSNAGLLFTSLIERGFPDDKIGPDITLFDGLSTHIIRVPAPKREGLKRPRRADGREFEDTLFIVDKIHKLPWEKGKSKATGKAATGAEADSALVERAEEFVLGLLAENPDGVAKRTLPKAVFDACKGDDRKVMTKIVHDDVFLSSADRPWKFENGVVTLG